MDHEFCARVLQSAVVFDQLNVSELACMELICRKLQMAEYRHGAARGSLLVHGNRRDSENAHECPSIVGPRDQRTPP